MLKFAANLSLLFTETELVHRFGAARQHGFAAVEIQFPYALAATTLKHALADAELALVLFNVDADDLLQGGEGLACVPEKRGQFLRAVDQALAYAEILRPQAINVLPGRCLVDSRRPLYLETLAENLRHAADAFAGLGIKAVFEAINSHDMPGFLIHSGEQMLKMLEQLGHPNLFMQYDIYHMQMMAEMPEAFIADHAEAIGHIQFADCPGRGQPGSGQIDFKRLFAVIAKSGYSGWVGAEYKPTDGTAASLGWLYAASGQENGRS